MTEKLYTTLADEYDVVCSLKDYKLEAAFIDEQIKKNKIKGKTLLDVACGTGTHAKFLTENGYNVIGVDKNSGVLAIARTKVPTVQFLEEDMRTFKLNKKFDVVTCMFNSINYNLTKRELLESFKNFREHIKDSGLIFFDFFLPFEATAEAFFLDKSTVLLHDYKDEDKVRVATAYLICKKGKDTKVTKDIHRIRLYSLEEVADIVEKAGLDYKLYWDFSLTKERGETPVMVCKKKKG